jgi:hypothetical protein
MKLTMPETLKHLLIDDWEAITKNQQVGHFAALVAHPSHPANRSSLCPASQA